MKKWVRDPGGHGITEGIIWQQLLMFFLPILLGTFFQQLYNTADAMIVGKYVGKEALAAVGGATGNLINLIVGFFVGLSSGATVVLSQFFGARDEQGASRSVHTAMAMALCFGAFLTAAGLILSPTLLAWMNTPEDVMGPAMAYLRIYFMGMIPSLIYNIGSGILRAVGDSRRPLYFLITACVTNIVLDLLFVIGMDLEVAGAAWATILSQAVSAVMVLAVLMRSPRVYRLYPKKIRFHSGLFGRIIRIGLPAGLQSVMFSISNVLIQTFINSFGTNVTAAWSAWSRIDSFQWMILNAFGISITTFVGQNYGAGKMKRVRQGVSQCLVMAFGGSLLCSALLLLFGNTLFRLFASDQDVVDQGMVVLRIIAPFYFAYTCVEIFSGALRGAGKTILPTLFVLCGVCVFRLLWLWTVASANRTVQMTVLAYPVTWAVTSLMFILYYLRWIRQKTRGREDPAEPVPVSD